LHPSIATSYNRTACATESTTTPNEAGEILLEISFDHVQLFGFNGLSKLLQISSVMRQHWQAAFFMLGAK